MPDLRELLQIWRHSTAQHSVASGDSRWGINEAFKDKQRTSRFKLNRPPLTSHVFTPNSNMLLVPPAGGEVGAEVC